MNKYPLAKPYLDKVDEDGVLEVLRSGCLSLGPKYQEFERQFAEKVGTKYACAVSSGTCGLHLTLIAAGVKPGDEVITSPFSFIASSNCIVYVGATPIFVDVDEMTYNLDPALIEKVITDKTTAIVIPHIFGQSADMDPIMELAKKYNLHVIEDACESLCAEYKGTKVGGIGESGVFAFYANKQMTTGEGGMIVTNDERIYKLCASLRNQGRSDNLQWLDHVHLGYNYRMDEMSASLGITQLAKLDYFISERQKIALWYEEALASYSDMVTSPQTADYTTNTWFVYVVRLQKYVDKRDHLILDLAKQGVSTKPYLPSIHLSDYYQKNFSINTEGMFPVSESVSASSLALPFYIGLTKEDIKAIIEYLISTLRAYET